MCWLRYCRCQAVLCLLDTHPTPQGRNEPGSPGATARNEQAACGEKSCGRTLTLQQPVVGVRVGPQEWDETQHCWVSSKAHTHPQGPSAALCAPSAAFHEAAAAYRALGRPRPCRQLLALE